MVGFRQICRRVCPSRPGSMRTSIFLIFNFFYYFYLLIILYIYMYFFFENFGFVKMASVHEILHQNVTPGSRFCVVGFWSNQPFSTRAEGNLEANWKTSQRVENALHLCFAFVRSCHSPKCAYEYSFRRPGLHFKVSLQFLENIICCYF